MSNEHETRPNSQHETTYEIRIMGHLTAQWADWFEDFTITLEDDGVTRLTGSVVDQTALHGLLKKIRNLGIPLLSVNPIEPDNSNNQ